MLLALATTASAWSAYQATRWSGLQTIHFSEATAARLEATRASNTAGQKFSIDVGLFVQYAEAVSENNQKQSDFLYQRFPSRLKTAVDEWRKTEPLTNPDAPGSPFEMEVYKVDEQEKAREYIDLAEQKFEEAKDDNQNGDNYVLLTVLFASVLFFAGISTKFETFRIKVAMVILSAGVFVITLLQLVQYPVH